MIRFQSRLPFGSPLFALGLLLLLSTLSILAASTAKSQQLANSTKNVAQIDCITPDGHITHITPLASQDSEATALIKNDDTVSCSLQEGQTEFVITLPKTSVLDRLTFLNENATAAGNLTISVSNNRLPADSPKWTRVEGTIAFAHKRTFDLSLIGIEAKFVKLSFNVSKKGNLAAVRLYGQQSLGDFASR